MVPRSAPYDCPIQPPFKPLMAPFSLLQPHTGALFKGDLLVTERHARYHNDQDSKLSSLVPRLALYDCLIWAQFKLLTALFRGPLTAPFKGEWLITKKPDKYQNDQHDKMTALVPEAAPYDCPIQAPFKPLTAPFKIPLQPLTAPFRGDNFPIQHHKTDQNV